MPEYHAGYRPERSPCIADRNQRFFIAAFIELLQSPERINSGQVSYGKEIGALQGKHKVDVYGPVTNTF